MVFFVGLLFCLIFLLRNKINVKSLAFINSSTIKENIEEKLRVSRD